MLLYMHGYAQRSSRHHAHLEARAQREVLVREVLVREVLVVAVLAHH